MTRASRTQRPGPRPFADPADGAGAPLAALRTAQADGIGLWVWFSTTAVESAGRFGGEMAQFAAARLRKDLAAQQALWGCRSLESVAAVQTRMMCDALEDYATEAGRLVEMSGEMADSALRRMR